VRRDSNAMAPGKRTSLESHFTQKRLATRATSSDRVTLSDMKFIVTENGNRQARVLGSEEEWRTALKDNFALETLSN